MCRHKILSIMVLFATCWHSLEFGAFRAATRAFSARTHKKAATKAAVLGTALLGGYQASHNFSANQTPKLTKRDIIRNIIEKNDIAQLKKMGPSLLPIDIALAFEQLIFNQGSLQAIVTLIPYAKQEEIHYAFTSSAFAKRKDILEYMIHAGIKIDTDTHDHALSNAVQQQSSDIIDLLYPLTTKTNQSLASAANIGNLTLVQKMALKADDFDTALCETIRSFSTYIIRRKPLDKYHKIVEFLSNQSNGFTNALAAACKYKDTTTFTHLLPKCSNPSRALLESISSNDLSYARLILSHYKDALPSDLLDTVVLEAVKCMKMEREVGYAHSDERAQLIDEHLPKVTDPIILTTIFKIYPDKQKSYSAEQLNAIKLFASFAGENWVEKLLSNNEPEKDSVTAMLLRKYKTHTDDSTLTKFCENTGLKRLPLVGVVDKLDCAVSQIAAIEHDDQKNDYTTFVHGRQWEWNFVNDVFNIMTALKEDQAKIPETISMRQRDANCDRSLLLAYRKKLIKQGIKGAHLVSCTNDDTSLEDQPERSEVTFMNYTGLSHLDCLPECSMRYFLQNHSATGGDAGYTWAQKLIAQHGLSAYLSHFEDLYKAHQASSSFGEMLTISVANKYIDAIVYPAEIGGFRAQGSASQEVAALKKEIYQPGPVTIKKGAPIFCGAALNIPGEDETMYKIRSVNLADRAKYQQYLEQRNQLFAKLKNEVRYEKHDAATIDHQKFMSAFID